MYAVVGTWDISPASAEVSTHVLHAMIVPSVKQAPGLVKGYWSGGVDGGRAHTYIVFDSQESATAFEASVLANAAHQREAGVDLIELVVEAVTAET